MKQARLTILLGLLGTLSLPAVAMGLTDAVSAALDHNADYRVQRLDRDAQQLAGPIARAALLPNISLSSTRLTNQGDREQTSAGLGLTRSLDYRSRQSSINLRQPLYHPDARIRYRQGKLQAEQADIVLLGRRMELTVQVATAYFDVLFAQDTIGLADSELASVKGQIGAAQQRFSRGEGTRTEVAEAQTRRDLTEAKLIDAHDRLAVARAQLSKLTGVSDPALRRPHDGAPTVAVSPAALSDWLQLAEERNVDVLALRVQAHAAQLEIERNRAGHHPRVDFVASVTDAKNDTLNTLNTSSLVRSAGVQVTMPIYSGGATSASVEQAVIQREKANASLAAATQTAVESTRARYVSVMAAARKLQVYERAVRSSQIALEGTQLGFGAGIRTNLEVLDAQRQMQETRRERAQARYLYLLGLLQLKAAAGTLTDLDVHAIDQQLTVAPISASSKSELPR